MTLAICMLMCSGANIKNVLGEEGFKPGAYTREGWGQIPHRPFLKVLSNRILTS